MLKADVERELSPMKKMILEALYKYRGVTVEQLLSILYNDRFMIKPDARFNRTKPNLEAKNGVQSTAQRNLAKYLSDLTREGYITSELIHQRRKIYFLSREGLYYIKGQLRILWNYIGTGYDDDLGDFQYELARPPLRQVSHHLLLIDFFIKVIEFTQGFLQRSNYTINFRDNRYCSEEFKLDSNVHRHRPDAEIRITDRTNNSRQYLIEIDRSTEYSGSILQKFERYKLYFEYLDHVSRPLPEAIIFITDEKEHDRGTRARWKTITEAFFVHLSKWAAKVNLIYGTLSEVADILSNEIAHSQIHEKLVKGKLKYYFQTPSYKGTDFIELQLDWGPVLVSVTHHADYHLAFLYERNHGFETRGYARAIAFSNYLKRAKEEVSSLKYVRKVVPIFYHTDANNRIIPIKYSSIIDVKQHENLKSPIWVNVLEDPTWTDNNGNKLNTYPLT